MENEKNSRNVRLKFNNLNNYIIYIAFLVIFVFFSIFLFDKGFLEVVNLMNIARQTATISIMSIGMTFVLAAGEIDLSVGAVVGLSSVVTALALRNGNIWIAIIAGLGIGVIIGLINGVLVTVVKIPSFLVTLGMMGIITGFSRWITDLKSIPIVNERFNFIFGSGSFGPIPILFIWTLVILILGQITLRKTTLGRYTLATGGNLVGSIFSGIKVKKIKLYILLICSILAALAGMLYAGRLGGGKYTFGENDLMTVLAAVIIGGTSLFGGKATVLGAVIGSLIMGMINNGLILMGLSVAQQMMLRGVIIIAAMAFTTKSSKSSI